VLFHDGFIIDALPLQLLHKGSRSDFDACGEEVGFIDVLSKKFEKTIKAYRRRHGTAQCHFTTKLFYDYIDAIQSLTTNFCATLLLYL